MKIDAYFIKNCFQICLFEHTLYIKFIEPSDIFIVCLSANDLIFTGNNLKMVAKLIEAMVKYFEMTNLGLISYFLVIEGIL